MKTILKSMVALSLVSSVAMGANNVKMYEKNEDGIYEVKMYEKNEDGIYEEIDVNVKIEDYAKDEFFQDCNLKLEYGKDENNVGRLIVVMANGEKAIFEYFNLGTDSDGNYFTLESELWVKKDGKRGVIDGTSCPTTWMRKESPEEYNDDFVPDFEEYDYLDIIQGTNEIVRNEMKKKETK